MIAALLLAAAPPAIQTVQTPQETYGDWTVAFVAENMAIATTVNNAGATLGAICTKASCTGFFNPKTTCTNGQDYPGLINAPASAFSVMMRCEKINDFFVLDIPLEGGVTDAMSVGGVLGLAFPMASGEFKVARFSLTGAARATARAQQYVQAAPANAKQQASDNYSL